MFSEFPKNYSLLSWVDSCQGCGGKNQEWDVAAFLWDIRHPWASLIAQLLKNPPPMQETPVWFLIGKIPWRRDRLPTTIVLGFLCGSAGKDSPLTAGDLGLIPGLGRFPWRRERLPTPVLWPREFHGLYSPLDHKESDTYERLSQIIEDHIKTHQFVLQLNTHSDLDWTSALPLVNHNKWFCPSTRDFMINEGKFSQTAKQNETIQMSNFIKLKVVRL